MADRVLSTPVVLFAFTRPHLTERTLAAIAAAKPTTLFLIADGPRADHPDDAEKCAATRQVLERVPEGCHVHRRYAETNLGLEANVELGLDWVFSLVDRAIVLEDDCVPHPDFFQFADDMLARYADDERIWQVSGSNFDVPRQLFGGASYAFTAWASVWGWATWADRWQEHRTMFPRNHLDGDAPVRTTPAEPSRGRLVTASGRRHFEDAAVSQDTITHGWDKHFWLSMLTRDRLAITPAANLVANEGAGADATHARTDGLMYGEAEGITFPVVDPASVTVNTDVEREIELVLGRVGGRAAVLARTVVRSPFLRRIARRLVHSRFAAYLTRQASRLASRSPRG